MNNIHHYNMTMGNMDVADQLRGNYWLDLGVRNRKWWWSIMFWSIGIILINAYILYSQIQEDQGTLPSKRLTQYDLQCAVAMAWSNQKEYK